MGILNNDDEKRMTFTEHLGELRIRLIRIIAGLALAFTVCLWFWEKIFNFLSYPLLAAKVDWISIRPMESMGVGFRLAMIGAGLICLPHVVYEICAFIFPGLKPKERRMAMALLGGCGVLAIIGSLVAYFLVSPQLISLMSQWTPAIVKQQLQMSETINFEVMLLLAFAVAFQFPMIVMILVFLGLITPKMLSQYRRIVIVLLAVAAAALTPTTDPISFLVMWGPLVLMYEACIWISYLLARKNKTQS